MDQTDLSTSKQRCQIDVEEYVDLWLPTSRREITKDSTVILGHVPAGFALILVDYYSISTNYYSISTVTTVSLQITIQYLYSYYSNYTEYLHSYYSISTVTTLSISTVTTVSLQLPRTVTLNIFTIRLSQSSYRFLVLIQMYESKELV